MEVHYVVFHSLLENQAVEGYYVLSSSYSIWPPTRKLPR